MIFRIVSANEPNTSKHHQDIKNHCKDEVESETAETQSTDTAHCNLNHQPRHDPCICSTYTADPVCVRHWMWTPGTMSVRRPLPGHILVKRDAVDSFLSVKSKRGLKLLNQEYVLDSPNSQ